MIIDYSRVFLKSGKGGDGSSAFIRRGDKLVPDGGPGGRGADVVIRTNGNLYDLSKFQYTRKFIAPAGEDGSSRNKSGRNAATLYIDVPPGTMVRDSEENLIIDMCGDPREFTALSGGEGGKGSFKRHFAEEGVPAEEREVIFDYRILNDVVLTGFANTGKTSLFNALTGQDHKVAEYPFTTSSCSWAVAAGEQARFVLLDTPSVRDRADEPFLKHLFRSRAVAIVCDDPSSCEEDARRIVQKLERFDPAYRRKKNFYLLNKIDKISKDYRKTGWQCVSALKGWGITELKETFLRLAAGR